MNVATQLKDSALRFLSLATRQKAVEGQDTILEASGLSDVGQHRKRNEDTILCAPKYGLFAVADGMGGGTAGNFASGLTIDIIRRHVFGVPRQEETGSVEDATRAAHDAIVEANQRIHAMAQDSEKSNTGTTIVLMLLDVKGRSSGVLMHAGDSRAYRFLNGRLTQLTNDHSVSERYKNKRLKKELKNLITRAVGVQPKIDVEEQSFDEERDALYLLCSDGLTNMVPDREITRILKKLLPETLKKQAQGLVDAANSAGGIDNISVVLIRRGTNEQDDGNPMPLPNDEDATDEGTNVITNQITEEAASLLDDTVEDSDAKTQTRERD